MPFLLSQDFLRGWLIQYKTYESSTQLWNDRITEYLRLGKTPMVTKSNLQPSPTDARPQVPYPQFFPTLFWALSGVIELDQPRGAFSSTWRGADNRIVPQIPLTPHLPQQGLGNWEVRIRLNFSKQGTINYFLSCCTINRWWWINRLLI